MTTRDRLKSVVVGVVPPNSPTVPVPPRSAAPGAPDRLRALVYPPEPGQPADPPPDPGAAGPVPREGGGPPAGPVQEERKHGLTVGWFDGLRFSSADDAFHLHVGGNA